MSHPPQPKLWYLLVVLKKAGISLEQVGDEMGLPFWVMSFVSSSCLISGHVTTFVFYTTIFKGVSQDDWPAKHAILEKLTESLPKMKQTRRKAEKGFNEWWLVANRGYQLRRYPQI